MSQFGGVGASLAEGGASGRAYGPPIASPASDAQDAFYQPANRLSPRALLVTPPAQGAPAQVAGINPQRRSLTISNALGTSTVWIGDDPSVQAGQNAFPIPAGAVLAFEPREYVGHVYATLAAGAPNVTIYVSELA